MGKIFNTGIFNGLGGSSAKTMALLGITTEPSAPFAKGSSYYNSTTKKIYTAVADDTWVNAKVSDPSFSTYYTYNGKTYVWDGNSLELFELEDYQKTEDRVNDVNPYSTSTTKYPSTKAVYDFVKSQGIARSFADAGITKTTSSDTILELAQEIQSKQLAVGTTLFGEIRNQGMPTGLANAEVRVDILETKNDQEHHQVILFTVYSTNFAPYEWSYTYYLDNPVVWRSYPLSSDVWTPENLIAGTNISITQVPSPVIDEHTLALWNFESGVNDIIHNIAANTNSGDGTPSQSATKKFGEYGGVSSARLVYNLSSVLPEGTKQFTLDWWEYSTSIDNSFGEVYLCNYTNINTRPPVVGIDGGQYYFYVNSQSQYLGSSAMGSFPKQTWMHRCLTVDSETGVGKYYQNGNLITTLTVTPFSISATNFSLLINSTYGKVYDEIRVSDVIRWDSNFTPFDEPYTSGGTAVYTIDATDSYTTKNVTAGKNITISEIAEIVNATNFGSGCISIPWKNPTTSMEIVMHTKTPNPYLGTENVVWEASLGFHFQKYGTSSNDPFKMWAVDSNGTPIMENYTVAPMVDAGTDFWFKIQWTGTQYSFSYKTTGDWVEYGTLSSTAAVYSPDSTMSLGRYQLGNPGTQNWSTGIFYLRDCYIKIDGEYVFNGATAVQGTDFSLIGSPTITTGGNTNYIVSSEQALPTATASTLGMVKPDGTTTTVDANGVISANATLPSTVYTKDNLLAGSNISIVEQVGDPNTVALWDFEEGTADVISGITSTYGNPLLSTNAHFGNYGMGSDGNSPSAAAYPLSSVLSGTQQITLDWWQLCTRNYFDFLSFGISTSNNPFYESDYFLWLAQNNSSEVTPYVNGTPTSRVTLTGATPNRYDHYCLTLDANTGDVQFFYNGERKVNTTVTPFTIDATNLKLVKVGDYYTYVDEIRISNCIRWEGERFDVPTEPYDYNKRIYKINNTFTPSLTWYSGSRGNTLTIVDTSAANIVKIYKNGLLLQPSADYTISGTTLTMEVSLIETDKIALEVI